MGLVGFGDVVVIMLSTQKQKKRISVIISPPSPYEVCSELLRIFLAGMRRRFNIERTPERCIGVERASERCLGVERTSHRCVGVERTSERCFGVERTSERCFGVFSARN